MIYRLYFIFLILATAAGNGYAQILDDTTKQIYGAHTSKYVLESDILNLDSTQYGPDTSSYEIHRLPQIFGKNTFYQNLGNFASPLQYYGYKMPDRPGHRFGFDVFDVYAFNPDKIKFYDTKSPFSEVRYVQGSKGQQVIDLIYTRNINWHWNFGFDYRRYVSKKNIGLVRRVNQAMGNSFDLHTRYFTARGRKYQILASFSYADILYQETGGIRPLASDSGSLDSLYEDIRENAFMNQSRSNDKRFEYRIYQELPVFKNNSLQIYNKFSYTRRFTWMKENSSVADIAYLDSLNLTYKDSLIHPAGRYEQLSTYNNTVLQVKENEAGIKGVISGIVYKFHYRYRNLFYYHGYLPDRIDITEKYAGGHVHYTLPNSLRLTAETETRLNGPDLTFKAAVQHKLFGAGYRYLKYSPSLFELFWAGNYLQWNAFSDSSSVVRDTKLKPTSTSQLYANFNIEKKRFFANAEASYSSISNYIYLDTAAYRRQANDNQKINQFELKTALGVNLFNIHVENFNTFFKVSGAKNLLQLPAVLNRTRVYFENVIGNSANFQIGFDLNYRSSYFADKYFPFHRHFYLNNTTKLPAYMYANVFADVRIKTVTGFIMFEHITQGLTKQGLFGPGYFETPGYTGMPSNFVFGIYWKFYN